MYIGRKGWGKRESRPEALHEVAFQVELQDRVQVGPGALISAPPVEDPQVLSIGIGDDGVPGQAEVLGHLFDGQIPTQVLDSLLEAARRSSERVEEHVGLDSNAAIGAPHFTMRNVEIHSRLGQARVAHPADVIAVDRFDSLSAARASRPRGLVRGERDQTVGACPDLLNRLPYWKDSRKREVRCYTENGHRVRFGRERGVGLQTAISCSTQEPVSIFLQAIGNCIDEEPKKNGALVGEGPVWSPSRVGS